MGITIFIFAIGFLFAGITFSIIGKTIKVFIVTESLFLVFSCPLEAKDFVNELILKSPANKSVTVLPFPHFTWSEHPAAFKEVGSPVSYEIQIAKDWNFRKIVDCDTISLNRYVHDLSLKPGKYFWRVRALPYKSKPDSWSALFNFRIKDCDYVIRVLKPTKMEDHTMQVLKAITKATNLSKKGRTVRLIFPSGDYYFGKTFTGGLLKLDDCKGIIIDGIGANLHFSHRNQGLFSSERSENIVVNGFTIHYPKGSLFSQGWVKSVDLQNNKVVILFDQGHNFDSDQVQWNSDFCYLLDSVIDGRLKSKTSFFFRLKNDCIKNSDGTWTFTVNGKIEQWKVGDRFCFQYRSGSTPLMLLKESKSITAYGVTSYGVGTFHYAAYGGSVFNVLHCKTLIPNGEWMSGNADGLHVRGSIIGPWMEGCNFQAMGDDAVALYARPASMLQIHPADNRNAVICKSDFFNLGVGDDVAFFKPIGGKILIETKVKKVKLLEDGQSEVIFEDTIPQNMNIIGTLQDVVQIWNRSKSSGDFVIRKNRFENIRRFGTVFRAKRGVVEENVYIGTSERAIAFVNEPAWPNGLYCSEIIIRNNRIKDSGFDSATAKKASIVMNFSGRNSSATSIGPRNILIEGNLFVNSQSNEIEINKTQNAVIRNNNNLLPSGEFIPALISIKNSEGVSIQDSK